MTLNFAAEPLSKNDDLLKDLQQNVSSGKVGDISVDADYILNAEPDVGKILTQSAYNKREIILHYILVTCIIFALQPLMWECLF